jgi:hypothetical protein
MKALVVVFWAMIPRSIIRSYQLFEEICCLHLQRILPWRRIISSSFTPLIWKQRGAGIAQSVERLGTGWTTGVGVQVLVGSRIFSSPCHPDRFWGPPSLLSNGYRGVKRPGCEADHSPPASAKVKKMWIYISTPPYAFMA